MSSLGARSKRARAAVGGTDQVGVRLYNERLILSLVRRHASLTRPDIARLTGLSLQTVSVITNQLSTEGLLRRGHAQRGRVGQPSIPYSLNPAGAYAFGLKIGWRSADLCLVDFVGNVLWHDHQAYEQPTHEGAVNFALASMEAALAHLPLDVTCRIRGLGITVPPNMRFLPSEELRKTLAERQDLPVYTSTDIAAACAAELIFGRGAEHSDYLYLFIGALIGGGLVLGGHLFRGRNDNVVALGALPAHGHPGRLLGEFASIHALERRLSAEGRETAFLWQSPDDWGADLGPALDEWITEMAVSLARAIHTAIAIVDIDTVVVDGAFPASVRRKLVEALRAEIASLEREGISTYALVEGTLGSGARARGAAAIPLLVNFTKDPDVLFKQSD